MADRNAAFRKDSPMFFKDIVDTWKISWRPGSNWRALHAGGALFASCGLLFACVWSLIVDWPQLFRAVICLISALLFFAYWRYLLPIAKHIHEVQRILSE